VQVDRPNTGPGAPTGLEASPAAAGVTLTWAAAGDDTGIAGYEVYRDGVLLGSTAATTFTDGGAVPGTVVSYRVRAIDLDGVAGPLSATVTVTAGAVVQPPGRGTTGRTPPPGAAGAVTGPPDVTPRPSPPRLLRVKRLTRTTALLTWRPAGEGPAVKYYQAERDRHLLRRTTSTTTVVLVTRYRSLLRVRAVDENGVAGRAASVIVPRWRSR
jgi:hypothetical protein